MEIEVVVNKEILDYKENIFFGLSLRQFICSLAAVAIAVTVYLFFDDKLGRQMASWLCILCAAPVAVTGFFKYNGLTFERLLWAIFKTKVLLAGRRLYRSVNYRYLLLQEAQMEAEWEKKYRPIQRQWQLIKRAVFGRDGFSNHTKKSVHYHHGRLRHNNHTKHIGMKDQQNNRRNQENSNSARN